MVRYSHGLVEVNVNHHLANELEIVMHGASALHLGDFILPVACCGEGRSARGLLRRRTAPGF
jgi:hypothetical protein